MSSPATSAQPKPKPGKDDVIDLVIEDFRARAEMCSKDYGTGLQTFNGRDALIDLYQELMDAVMYLRQLIAEEDRRGEQE